MAKEASKVLTAKVMRHTVQSCTRLSAVAFQFEIQEGKVCPSYTLLSFSPCRSIS